MIDGVCGGIAAYAGVDATLVRLAWVLITLIGGSGILLYIAAMILMPKEAESPGTGTTVPPPGSRKTNTTFWGILFVGAGLFWLAVNLGMPVWHHWWGFSMQIVVPLLLILMGVTFLFGGRNYFSVAPEDASSPRGTDDDFSRESPGAEQSRLTRSRTDKKLAGVCGGIGAAMKVDPVIVRLGFVLAALASVGIMLVIYIVLAIVVPLEPENTPEPAGAGI